MGNPHPLLKGSDLSPEVVAESMERVIKARSILIRRSPFFATLALSMDVHITDAVPTAATTYDALYFSPNFLKTLSDPEVVFLVCHEVMHPMFHHNTRIGSRDKKLWNIAADIVINEHICTDPVLGEQNTARMPECGVRSTDIFNQGDGQTERIYDILLQMADEQNDKGKGKKGKGGGEGQSGLGSGVPDEAPWDDILEDSNATPSEVAERESTMNVRVAQAAQAAKMAGKMSANIARLVGEILDPKIDWRDVLRSFVFKARTDDRSFARPNRRFVSQGLIMPSVSGEQMGEMLIAVDCSGSIGERELNEFAAEIKAIHEDTCPIRTHIVYFDSQVCHHDEYSREDTVEISPHGGGGTAFSPVFRFAEDHDINPVCCVFLTDLYCNDFGPEVDYPVLWVTNGTDKAPWGQVIKM